MATGRRSTCGVGGIARHGQMLGGARPVVHQQIQHAAAGRERLEDLSPRRLLESEHTHTCRRQGVGVAGGGFGEGEQGADGELR